MFQQVDILIMQNAVKCQKENQKMTFDVKGSHHHRLVPFSEKWWLKKVQKVMKCRNLMKINEDYN
jgi:hypothetical protein